MKKGSRYILGAGGPHGPLALGTFNNELSAVNRAKKAAAFPGSSFASVIDRHKGTAWQWRKGQTPGRLYRRGVKLPDGVAHALLTENIGGDLPPLEARRRIVASMLRKGGGSSVMGISLMKAIAPRYVVCLAVAGGYVPLCSARQPLDPIRLARKIAASAHGSKLYTVVNDQISGKSWTFKPDAKGRVVASGPGLPSEKKIPVPSSFKAQPSPVQRKVS